MSHPIAVAPAACFCGAPLVQSSRGRPRQHCSDVCRRAADAARKASRPKQPKPATCLICGEAIVQSATGRPRKLCPTCVPIVQGKRAALYAAAPSAYVYIFACTDSIYKIGYSRNVERRRYAVDPLAKIVHVIETQHPRRLENALHQQFAEWRVHGEYFALDESDLRWISRLGSQLPDGQLP